MNWKLIGLILLAIIVVANLMALNTLPDLIVKLNFVVLGLVLAGAAYVYWRRNQKQKNQDE
jgi:hypothetical protein